MAEKKKQLNEKRPILLWHQRKTLFGRWTQHGRFETIADIRMHENSIKML